MTFHLELDSDYDSHDGSDNENENSIKCEVSLTVLRRAHASGCFCSSPILCHLHRPRLPRRHHLVRRISDIVAIAVVMSV